MEQKNDGPRRRWWVLDLQQCINAPFILERIGVWTSPESDWDEGYSKNAEQRDVEVILRDKRSGTPVSLGDVGVGISQVIPVLVAARDQSLPIAYIEQPELHLHPKQQAMLGDVFAKQTIKGARWYEPGDGEQSQERTIIVETHSENLLLRLLRRIRESNKNLQPDGLNIRTNDVAIYFFQHSEGYTKATRIDVDVNGDFIQPWPDDFFEIDFYERFA